MNSMLNVRQRIRKKRAMIERELLFHDENTNLFINKNAADYIKQLKVGTIIKFKHKGLSHFQRKENKKIYSGQIKQILRDKFFVNVELGNGDYQMAMVSINDITDGTYMEVKEDETKENKI